MVTWRVARCWAWSMSFLCSASFADAVGQVEDGEGGGRDGQDGQDEACDRDRVDGLAIAAAGRRAWCLVCSDFGDGVAQLSASASRVRRAWSRFPAAGLSSWMITSPPRSAAA